MSGLPPELNASKMTFLMPASVMEAVAVASVIVSVPVPAEAAGEPEDGFIDTQLVANQLGRPADTRAVVESPAVLATLADNMSSQSRFICLPRFASW